MSKSKRFYYTIKKTSLEDLGVASVLDMLRYDQAVIHYNPPKGMYLLSNESGPCHDRWRSFGIQIVQGSYDHYELYQVSP